MQQNAAIDMTSKTIGNEDKLKQLALAVIATEAKAVAALASRIDDAFVRACELMLACEGRVIVLGMGKSGHIGNKIASTLASTGTPAFFVHPAEASHGDMGMLTANDIVLALSNSGETEEILLILPLIKRLGICLVAMTGNPRSTLARAATVCLDSSVEQEACPLGLAPTSSTTAALVLGDALAIALLEARGFTAEDFARSHPGGRLGRRLLLLIRDVMHAGAEVPRVAVTAKLSEALVEMTKKRLGMTAIVDEQGHAVGIFTDGDLRRLLDRQAVDVHAVCITDVMQRSCITVAPDALAMEALNVMEQHKINGLLVADQGVLVGALNMHNLLRAGVV